MPCRAWRGPAGWRTRRTLRSCDRSDGPRPRRLVDEARHVAVDTPRVPPCLGEATGARCHATQLVAVGRQRSQHAREIPGVARAVRRADALAPDHLSHLTLEGADDGQ